MTIKYSVSGAKTRNGKTITPMDFDDKRAAERFANYHEGTAVKQNRRKQPGKVQAWSDSAEDFAPTKEDTIAAKKFFAYGAGLGLKEHAVVSKTLDELAASGEPFRVDFPNGQSAGRAHRQITERGVTVVLDRRSFGPLVESTVPVFSIVSISVVSPLKPGMPAKQTTTQVAPVGNQVNEDLKAAYEMGYKQAVANSFWKGCHDEDIETQDYVDRRRSDLKELISFDRSID